MSEIAPDKSIGGLALKLGLSAIPVVGPVVSEIVGELLPNYRLERIESMLHELYRKVADLDPDWVRKRMAERVFVDLVEDSLRAAARASSSERLAQIASVVADGIRGGDVLVTDRRFILKVLEELNDIEVLLLVAKAKEWRSAGERKEFFEKHRAALHRPPAIHGKNEPGVVEGEAVFHAYELHLERLGLVEREPRLNTSTSRLFRRLGVGEQAVDPAAVDEAIEKRLREWDSRRQPTKLTAFGWLLLRSIGQGETKE